MDLSNPLRAATSGVEGDVLAVLLQTHLPLTGARVAALAQRGQTQVRAVLRRLARHGLVDVERHGQSYTFLLNRQHVLTPGLEALHGAMATVEDRIKDAVESWPIPPDSLIIFGSAARRDGDTNSDIDLLLVRPDALDADDETWAKQRHALTHDVEHLTGNVVQVIELSATELTHAIHGDEPLIRELRTDGAVLAGRDLTR